MAIQDHPKASTVSPHWSDWLMNSIWPQIHAMMLHDAFFKLFGFVHQLTGRYDGPFAELVISGYVANQTIAIRRLCDNRRDVISLRRLIEDMKSGGVIAEARSKQLLDQLDECNHICDLVNDHIAHTANPDRRRDVSPWTLRDTQITEAQKSICKVALILTRETRNTFVAHIIPVIQYDFMREFKTMVSTEQVQKLFQFWRSHSADIDRWCDEI